MQQWLSGTAGRGWFALTSLGLALGLAVACGGSDAGRGDETPGGGIFGGTGGVVEAVPRGGNSGTVGGSSGSGGSSANDCSGTPAGALALIDNFDDGDSIAAFEPGREAYWFMIHDATPGTLDPDKDFLPAPGGYLGTKSAHVLASGFTNWGGALVANISHKAALRCPYNASGFAGLRFVARGHGAVLVQLTMPEVLDKEYGGACDPAAGQVCYDQHSAYVQLTDEYQVFELPWSSFQQRGFGTPVTFNPKTLLSMYFAMLPNDLPIELWLDDVAWWDGKHSGGLDAGGGAGGAGGEAAGGQSNIGGAAAGAGGDG